MHKPAPTPGVTLYFIQAGTGGPIKIGYASSVTARRGHLQSGNAEKLAVIGQIAGSPAVESEWHSRFAHLRIRGEWFRPANDLLAAIKAADSSATTAN